jgi:hypothetical protein
MEDASPLASPATSSQEGETAGEVAEVSESADTADGPSLGESSPSWAMLGFVGCLSIVVSLVVGRTFDHASRADDSHNSRAEAAVSRGAELLPAEVRDWQLVDFHAARPSHSRAKHAFSNTWAYARTGYPTLLVTVDYPFIDGMRIMARQRLLGWKLVTSSVHQPEVSSADGTAASHWKAQLELTTGDTGYLFCGIPEDTGGWRTWLASEFRRGRFASAVGIQPRKDDRQFMLQLHLLVQTPAELSREQVLEIERCFDTLRNALR